MTSRLNSYRSPLQVACDPTAEAGVLRDLAQTESTFKVYAAICKHQNAPVDVLLFLAEKDYYLRALAALNENITVEYLRKWASHSNYDIRAAVALNPMIDADVAGLLSIDKMPEVRVTLLSNCAMPLRVYERLLRDNDIWVSSTALEMKPEIHKYLLTKFYGDDIPETTMPFSWLLRLGDFAGW